MVKVSYYNGNIYDSICRGHVDLEYWAKAQINPTVQIMEILDEVAAASKAKDHELKQKLKTESPLFEQ